MSEPIEPAPPQLFGDEQREAEPGSHRERHGHDYKPGHRPGHCGVMVMDIDGYGRDCGEAP